MRCFILILGLVLSVIPMAEAGAAGAPPGTVLLPVPQAQHRVTGIVTDSLNGLPIPGANIQVKGTLTGGATDLDGRYEILAPSSSDTLVFSFIGYIPLEVPIAGRSVVDVALRPTVELLEELVVTGYSTQRKADITGAVSVVEVEDIQGDPTNNPIQSLQGRVPGMFIDTDGSPFGNATVRIRGNTTLGNNAPLYVIDGVPSKTGAERMLNANDIESIQVLKDASSASIYGARASNGVIIITTRKAREETFDVTYNSSLTTSSYWSKLDPLTTEERGRVLWQAAINDGQDPDNLPIYDYDWERRPDGTAVLNRVIVPEFVGDPNDQIRSADTDWFEEISRPGFIQQHDLSVATGGPNGSALFSLGYHDNQAIIKEQDFRRLTARVNTDYRLLDGKIRFGENFALANSEGTPLPEGLGGSPLWLAIIAQPILPVHTEDGGWAGPSGAGFDDRDNPARLIAHNTWDRINTVQTFGNLFADVQLASNLMLNSRFGIDWERVVDRDIQRRFRSGFLSRTINSLEAVNNERFDWTFNSTLNYDLNVGDHDTDLLVGLEALQNDFQSRATYREEFAIEDENFFVESAGSGKQTVSGFRTGFSLLSFFGKANYAYRNKYLASATLRYDGSSRFGEENQFGTFPAFTLGWRVSDEPVFKNNLGFVSDFKLRFGWGKTGNQEIGNEARFALFRPNYGDDHTWGPSNGTAYDLFGNDSGTLPSGFLRTQRGNETLKWEETTEFNAGVDFSFLNYKLTGSFDYFQRATDDILIQPAFIAVVGDGGSRWANGASLEADGFEFLLGYEDQAGAIGYSITGNVSAFQDRITFLPPEVIDSYPGNAEQTILGQSQNALFGYVVDGLFQNQTEVEAHAVQPGKGVGRLRFRDLNGDGVINALDQRFLGDTNPDFAYGLQGQLAYGGFDVSFFLQGVQGPEVYNPRKVFTDLTSIWNGANYGSRTLDAWTPENPGSSIPAVTLADNNDEDRSSTYFIENGSYLKLREAQIGYTLPPNALGFARVDNARVYLRGENLFTIKDTSGVDAFTAVDPENPGNVFPRARNFSVGVSLSF